MQEEAGSSGVSTIEPQSWPYDFNLRFSRKIKDINAETELWQIGQDRLHEFTVVAHRMYDQLARESGSSIAIEAMEAEHHDWLSRAIFFAPVTGGEIAGTGAALRLWEQEQELYVPEPYEQHFNPRALLDRFRPRSLWVGTRNSVDKRMFASSSKALRAMQCAVSTGYDILAFEAGHLSISLISKTMLRRVRRLGYNWRLFDDKPVTHPLFTAPKFYRAFMDTREAWLK